MASAKTSLRYEITQKRNLLLGLEREERDMHVNPRGCLAMKRKQEGIRLKHKASFASKKIELLFVFLISRQKVNQKQEFFEKKHGIW